jgi:hypothetical protein
MASSPSVPPEALSDREWLRLAITPPAARNPADQALMDFGFDPWEIERFLRLSPAERLRRADYWANLASKRRRKLGIA